MSFINKLLGSDSLGIAAVNTPQRLVEVSACTHAAIGYVTQARAHSGPVEDVPRGV
jgi:hypothetical protein